LPPESPTTLINSNYYAMLFSDNLIDSYLLASARLIIDSAYPWDLIMLESASALEFIFTISA